MKRIFPAVAVCTLLALSAPRVRADVFYVSPHGADTNAGSAARPFATLERARQAERQARQAHPDRPETVWVAGGRYILPHPLELSQADSGTASAPTVFRAMEGEAPVLVGAAPVPAADFKPVTDAAVLALLPAAARGHVVALDVAALHVTHDTPFPDVFNDSGGILDLFVNGRRMPLSRYPKDGDFLHMRRVLDTGGGLQNGNWEDLTHVQPGKHGGTFEYYSEDAPHVAAWAKALDRGVWLKGYWRVPWENEAIRVRSINTQSQTITFAAPIPQGIGNKYNRPSGNGQEPFWILNSLTELSRPGEWCLDFPGHTLYFYPPVPLNRAKVCVADTTDAMLALNGASHVTVRGLTLEQTLGDGVDIRGGAQNLVAGCTVRDADGYAVRVDGGTGHVVLSNDLSHLGAGGVWLGGGDATTSPRTPAGDQVVNNHIWDFGEIVRVYAPGINCGYTGGGGGGSHTAVGMYVAHNLIHDCPHAGVLYGSFDNVFEYNEVYRFCTVSNDMGAFYSYDHYQTGGGETFRYNLVHDSGDGDGFYWDHDHREMHVYGNIVCLRSLPGGRGTGFLYKIGDQPTRPQSIDCHDNLAVQCNVGFQFVSALPSTLTGNAAVQCVTPYISHQVTGGQEVPVESLASGPEVTVGQDPGFVDAARLDFRLKPGSPLLTQLPGLSDIPQDKVGLFRDAYRRTLPGDAAIDRFNQHHGVSEEGDFTINDRK